MNILHQYRVAWNCFLLLLLLGVVCGQPAFPPWPAPAVDRNSSCVAAAAKQLDGRCRTQDGDDGQASLEAILSSYAACLGTVGQRPLNVLAPTSFQSWINRTASQYTQLSGQPVNVTYMDYYAIPLNIVQQHTASGNATAAPGASDSTANTTAGSNSGSSSSSSSSAIALAGTGAVQHDLYLLDGGSLPWLARGGFLLQLDSYISYDAGLAWDDVSPLWKAYGKLANVTYGMPIDSDCYLLYYRRDMFDRYGLRAPATWQQLADIAGVWEAMWVSGNLTTGGGASTGGTGSNSSAPVPRYGLCLNDARVCQHSYLLSAILASITQPEGPMQGWFVDLQAPAEEAGRLVNGTALQAALELLSSLMRHSPKGLVCQQTLQLFTNGSCLMTINWGRQFKALQRGTAAQGRSGVAVLPGSTTVYDRSMGQLVPASPHNCRDAIQVDSAGAGTGTGTGGPSAQWACRAPVLVYGGTYGAIAPRGPTYQNMAYWFLSYMMGKVPLLEGILDPTSPLEPVRSSMLAPNAYDLLVGLGTYGGAASYDPGDARAYLTALQQTFASPNAAQDINAPANTMMRLHLDMAALSYMAGVSAAAVGDQLLRSWLSEWGMVGYDMAAVQALLRAAQHDTAVAPTVNDTAGPPQPRSSKVPGWGIAVATVGSVVVVALLLGGACWARWRLALRRGLRRIAPPMCGDETTLVVTDIQDSTKLWECCHDADVMDYSITQHHSLARKLILKYGGYESATEGDSFIIAFHAPHDAVCFCAALQQELLWLPWPAELLALEGCAPMWMCKIEPEVASRRRMPSLPVQTPLSRFVSTPHANSPLHGLGSASPGGGGGGCRTPNESDPGNGSTFEGGGGGSAVGLAAAAAALAPGSAPGTPHHPTPGAGADGHLQGLGSSGPPQRSPSQVHRGRVTGSVGGGAFGASPRQLSFLGRSVARNGGSPLASGVAAAAAAARLDRSITLPPPRGEPLLPSAAVAALPPAASARVTGESGSGERDSAASGGRSSVVSRTTPLLQAGAEGVAQADASTVGSSAIFQQHEQQQQHRGWQSYDGRVPTFTGFDAIGLGAGVPSAAVSDNGGPAGPGAAATASLQHMRGPEAPAWTMGLSGVHEEEGSGRLVDDATPLSPASIVTNNGAGSGAMATVSEFKSSVSSMAHEEEGPHSALSIRRDGSHAEYPPRGRHGVHVHDHGSAHPGGDNGSVSASAPGPVAEGLSRREHVSRPQHGTRASARRASVTFDVGRGSGGGGGGGNGSSSDGAASASGGGSSRNSSRGLPRLQQGAGSPHTSSAGHSDDGAAAPGTYHHARAGLGGAPRGPRHLSDGPPPYKHGRRSMPSGGPPPPPPVDSLRRRSDASALLGPSDSAQAPIWHGGPHPSAMPRPVSAHGGESTLRPSPLSRASSRGGTTSCGGASATTASGASHGGHQRIPRTAAAHAPGTPTSPRSPTSPLDHNRQAFSPLPTLRLPPPVPPAAAADFPTPFAAIMAPGPSGQEESPSAQECLAQAAIKRHTSDSLTSPPAATRATTAHLGSFNAGPTLYRASIASCVALKGGRSNDGGAGGDDLDATLQVPAMRHSSIVFPVNRPAGDHVQGSALSVAASHPIPIATPNTPSGPFSPTAAAAASGGGPSHAPRSMLHASVSRGLFGLMSLPSPRGPGGGGGGGGLLGLGGSSHAQLAVDSRAASMASMMRLASQHNLQSVGDSLCTRWRVVDPGEPGAQLVFRGLRVRMGVHSGLKSEADVQLNRTANRMQYTGLGLQMAKAVCDCAHGGQVLMTEAAFTQLAVEGLQERVMVLHMGEHSMKEGLPPTSIYCGCPRSLQGRLPQLRTVRSRAQHSLGVLDAPAGSVCVVFMHVVGAMSLMDWRPELAHEALAMFRDHVTTELIKHQGYLVEAVDGLVLASFSSPASGLRWASRCERDMAQLPWPPELLQHEACEELVMPRRDPVTGVEEELLIFRGLRIKAGIDVGRLRGEINCITGRMSYRGRAMNRAARIVAAAGSGQLLASAEAWRAGSTQQAARLAGLSAVSLGQFALKGVSEAIEVYRIKTSAAAASKRATTVLSGRLDPLDTDDLPIADPLLALQHHAALSPAGTLGASPSALASPSAAAAGTGAGVITVGAASVQGTPTRSRSQRMGSGRAAGGLVAGVGGRLGALGFAGRSSSVTVPVVQPQVERMRSLGASGMVAAMQRGESVTAAGSGGRQALSRQMSKNLSRRSRLSSRQSSMGGQFSPLAANTMLSAARGSLDGRAELGLLALTAPPGPSGTHAPQPEAHHPQPLQPEAGPSAFSAATAAAQPAPSNATALAQLLSTNVSHVNTHTSASTISQPGYVTSHGATLGMGLFFNGSGAHPRTARTSRTSRASATTETGDAADQRSSNARSSNARSSNASIKSQPLLHQSVSSPIPRPAPAAAGGGIGAANAASAAPTPRLMGGHGLVRHLSTLIRSAGNALYGGGHQSHTVTGTVWGSSGLPSSPTGTAGHLSPTSVVAMSVAGVHADTVFESPPAGGGVGREHYRALRVTSDRPSREGAAAARAPAGGGGGGDGSRAPHILGSPLQLASPGALLARGGGGGGVLLDTLQTRLRAATGSIFRGGSFSGGHTLRLRPEELHATEYGDRQSRRARSPPNRRTVSTLTGNGFMFVGGDAVAGSTAGSAAAIGGGGFFLGGGGYRHRSAAVEHLRSPMLAAEGALGMESGGGGRRQGRRDRERAERERELELERERERWASAEGRANDSFVIVVGGENGESDGDEDEEEGDMEMAGVRVRRPPPPRLRVPRRGSAEAAAAAARRRSVGAVAVAPLASLGYTGSPARSCGSVTLAGRAPMATGGGGWRSAEWERGAVGGDGGSGGGGRGLSAGQVAVLMEGSGTAEDGGGEQGGNARPRPPSLSHPQTFLP